MNFGFLEKTVVLAHRGKNVFPNPRVGAIIVRRGKIIAEGWHKKFGGPHAEVDALMKLPSGGAKSATVYVSLEPCAEWKGKKTPSCAKRLTRERVKTVVIGMLDPNPHVRGKGIAILKRAGIRVIVAPPRIAFYDLNHEYLMQIANKSGERPFVFMKTAMSVDGKIGTPDHHSVALSTPEDRYAVDALRGECDAIMVGGITLRHDKPRLMVKDAKLVRQRIAEGRDAQPLPVAIAGGKLLVGPSAKANALALGRRDRYILGKKRVDLKKAMAILAIRYGVRMLLCEGGGELNASMLEAGYVDVLRIATAPVILGGRTAPTLVDGQGFPSGIALRCVHRERKGCMDIAWYAPLEITPALARPKGLWADYF